jgi:hypothetical protein
MFVYPNVFNIKIINQDFVLDGIDKEILLHLTENERTPILEIARSMGGVGCMDPSTRSQIGRRWYHFGKLCQNQ